VPTTLFPGPELRAVPAPALDAWVASLLRALSPLHYNVLVYIARFGREVLAHGAANGVQPDALALVLSRCLMRRIPHDEAPAHAVPDSPLADAMTAGTYSGGGGGGGGGGLLGGGDGEAEDGDPAVSLVGACADKGTLWEPTREEQDAMTRVMRHLLTTASLAV
jgi:hypothetical protein